MRQKKRIRNIAVFVVLSIAFVICICIYPIRRWAFLHGYVEAEAVDYDLVYVSQDDVVRQELMTSFDIIDKISLFVIPGILSETGQVYCNVVSEDGQVVGVSTIDLVTIQEYQLLTFGIHCKTPDQKYYLEFGMDNVQGQAQLIFIANPSEHLPNEYGTLYVNGVVNAKSLLFYMDYFRAPDSWLEANKYYNLVLLPAVLIIVLINGRRVKRDDADKETVEY